MGNGAPKTAIDDVKTTRDKVDKLVAIAASYSDKIEFWQGRENRLHDRIVYELVDSVWKIYRLAP